jgi:hypothetical protein
MFATNATASVVREERHARACAASRHPQPPPLARHAGRSRRGRIPLLLDLGAGGAGGEDEEAGRWGRWSALGRGGRRGRGGGARRAGEADRFPPIRLRWESSARRREVETRRLGAVRSAGSTAPASGSTARWRGGGGARRAGEVEGPPPRRRAAPRPARRGRATGSSPGPPTKGEEEGADAPVDLRLCSLPRAAERVAGAGRAGAAPSRCPAPPLGRREEGEREERGARGRWGGGESGWRERKKRRSLTCGTHKWWLV